MKLDTIGPIINRQNAFFWEGTRRGALLFQQCSDCGVLRHPPALNCLHCDSFDWMPKASSGKGSIYSFTTVHHPAISGFSTPYRVVLAALEEGVRFVGLLLDSGRKDPTIGDAIHVDFIDIGNDIALPVFKQVRLNGDE